MEMGFILPQSARIQGSMAFPSRRAEPSRHDNAPTRVLLVDTEPTSQDSLVDYLEAHSLCVAIASDPQGALCQVGALEPWLVILNLRRDSQESARLLRAIRERAGASAIIAIVQGDDEADRVTALELGADDCVAAPFSRRELVARIRAVLRRREAGLTASPRRPKQRRCEVGGWQLDHRTRRLTGPDGCSVLLTRSEHALLAAFFDAPRQPLTREQLIHATGIHEDRFDRSIDVRILRLRRKLTDSGAPRLIRTERGVGYMLDVPVEAS